MQPDQDFISSCQRFRIVKFHWGDHLHLGHWWSTFGQLDGELIFVSEKKLGKNTTGLCIYLYCIHIYIYTYIIYMESDFLKIFGVNLQKHFCSGFLGGFGWLLQNHFKLFIDPVLKNCGSNKTLQKVDFSNLSTTFWETFISFWNPFRGNNSFLQKNNSPANLKPLLTHDWRFWLPLVFLRRWRKMGAFSISTLVSSWAWSLEFRADWTI